MVQSSRPPSIDLSLTSGSAIDWGIVAVDHLSVPTSCLMLRPGQRGDMVIRIKNTSVYPLQVSLSIRGEFPAAWFTPSEPWPSVPQDRLQFNSADFALQPQQTLYKTLSFTLPDNFFEDPQALSQQRQLSLQYFSELYLYQRLSEATSPRLIGHQPFQLHTRPPRTYLEFLPEIYQQSDFLGRFLSIIEQAFDPTYSATENFWAYLDPLTAPKSLVPFLAHWVAWPMNPRLTLTQQRQLIRHAVEIYQWRGTRRGLQLCLHFCTGLPLDDHHIHIPEMDAVGFTLGNVDLSDEPCLGGGMAYHFSVILRPETPEQAAQLDETMIREIIEQEKPAFCTYDLTIEGVPI